PYLHALNNFRMRRLVSNAIMYSAPGHPFWMFYLQRLRESLVGKKPRQSTMQAAMVTGPVLLTNVALTFQQAHSGKGCPGLWCPHLAPPQRFLPVYDNSTVEMRQSFRQLCDSVFALQIVGFAEECRRFEPHGYRNYRLDPDQSCTFHAFLHLNQRAKDAEPKADVRDWGLGLVVGDELGAEIRQLGMGDG
uniref:Nucleotid_trans domain-containing protein n=1 Tax=Macrostomum lignano TaxID=282301 RepID=A0A1I8JAB8_9PLAT